MSAVPRPDRRTLDKFHHQKAIGALSSGSHIGAAAQPPTDQLAPGISSEALAQIEALIAEKESRTPAQQKIDPSIPRGNSRHRGQAPARPIDVGMA